ncbi:MAG: Gfo/Idh/MocA family oxidoreductase [Bacteroidetes bacterium]|nr:Gfo/Idh/MocA family oxidoreductase [Bacteroidota bacterium]
MSEEQLVKFAVCGYGNIGKRHAEEISMHPQADLIAIADCVEETAYLARDKYEIPVFSSMDFMLEDTQPDVVCICTPNSTHIPLALKVMRKHTNVLVEKPLGIRGGDCDALVFMAEAKKLNAWCVLQNRYSPPAQYLKKLIESRVLGKIYWVEINCYWNRDNRYYKPDSWRGALTTDGGTLYTQFSHFVDLMYWIFGGVKLQHTKFFNNNHPDIEFEDSGFFSFDFEKEGAGLFSWSTSVWDKNMESSITVIAENGSLKIGGQYMEKMEYFHVRDLDAPDLGIANPANAYKGFMGSANNHALVIDNVIKAMKKQPAEIATAEEAIESVKIIEEVYRYRII